MGKALRQAEIDGKRCAASAKDAFESFSFAPCWKVYKRRVCVFGSRCVNGKGG